METLNIMQNEEEEKILLDEELDNDTNEWEELHIDAKNYPNIKKLKYGSKDYNYFIRQDKDGYHYIYRTKKR